MTHSSICSGTSFRCRSNPSCSKCANSARLWNRTRAKALRTETGRAASLQLDFVLLLQLCDHPEILERRCIAFHFPAAGQLSQQAAHDLAAACFRECVGKADVI